MKHKLVALALLLVPSSAFASSPDLCADVYLDSTGAPYTDAIGQSLARYCQWTGPTPPVWNADVCCTVDGDGAHCSEPDVNGRCGIGLLMHCDYGEAVGGGVTCYQPFPDACDMGWCLDVAEPPPAVEPDLLCCSVSVCQEVEPDKIEECNGTLTWCGGGVTNEDGTVECISVL